MTLRAEEIRCVKTPEADGVIWHLRFKGVRGQGRYGSVITNSRGRGLYLLADDDIFGFPGYEQRMTCLLQPETFYLARNSDPGDAREAMVRVLLALGWGPRVEDRIRS